MVDLVAVAAVKGACDVAIGVYPFFHDLNTRKRLTRLDRLLQKIQHGSLSPEELIEADKIYSKIHTHAVMTQNATLLADLEKRLLLLRPKAPRNIWTLLYRV
jgi:hypothetical protein